MMRWIIGKARGFTYVGLLRISDSVRTYTYLILSSQASARSCIIGNTASALTATYSDMNLSIRSGTVGYNDKILVSDSGFSLGKNDMVNTTVPEKTSSIASKHAYKASVVHAPLKPTSAIAYEEGKIALVLVLTSAHLRNMVSFSIMKGTGQGDPIEVTSEHLTSF